MKLSAIIAVLGICIFSVSCLKPDTYNCNFDACAVVAPQAEIDTVEAYIKRNNIQGAIKHCSGMYYKITDPGTGSDITRCSTIYVYYDGKVKDRADYFAAPGTYTPQLPISGTIRAWQIGIPLIKTGGKITLYIPPSLGYGNSSPDVNTIPNNSMLIFNITGVSL